MIDLRSVLRLPSRRPRLRVINVSERPANLEILLVPETIAAATLTHLRAAAARRCEEFAFWSGHALSERTAIVSRAFHPRTTQSSGHVSIDDDEQLLAMTDLVHEHDELVLCQLHTHPKDAFHSEIDDQGAFTDEVGFLSFVLPDFGERGLEAAEAYRRTERGWTPVGPALACGLIRIVEDLLCYAGGGWCRG